MRKVHATVQMTLDGVAEWPVYPDDAGGGDDDSDFWDSMYTSYWDSIDTLLLGRHTYVKWAAHWPKVRHQADAGKYPRQFSEFADRVEKIVFSRTLDSGPWERTRVVRGDLAGEMAQLRAQTGGNLLVGGGPRLTQSLLRLGLIDDLRMVVFPSVVGRGKPMFDVDRVPDNPEDRVPLGAPLRHDFRLVQARPLRSGGGAIFLHYNATKD